MSDTLKQEILAELIADCQRHEHRGCSCSPKDAEDCWGNEADSDISLEEIE